MPSQTNSTCATNQCESYYFSFQPDLALHPHHWHRSHELLHALRLGREGCHFYDDDEEDEDDDDVENDDDVEC